MHLVQLGHLPGEKVSLAIELEAFKELPLPQFELLLAGLHLEPDLPPSEVVVLGAPSPHDHSCFVSWQECLSPYDSHSTARSGGSISQSTCEQLMCTTALKLWLKVYFLCHCAWSQSQRKHTTSHETVEAHSLC